MFALLICLLGCVRPCRLARDSRGADQWGRLLGSEHCTAMLVALWNYMGWDNASTVAQEVEHPQRNYPRAMVWILFW